MGVACTALALRSVRMSAAIRAVGPISGRRKGFGLRHRSLGHICVVDWFLVGGLAAVGVALLAWDRRLQRHMSPAERDRGRRNVWLLYGSWSFVVAFLALLVTVTALVAKDWPLTFGALAITLLASLFALKRWGALKRQA